MWQILLSILVPVYKVESFIERCSHSLFRQTIKNNIEFIFVDDCSPDESIERLQETLDLYPERKGQVKIIKHAHNMGLGQTRNTALENASGKYVYIIDSDDWLLQDNALELMMDKALQTGADIVEADYKVIESCGEKKRSNNRNFNNTILMISDIIRKRAQITIWNKLISRDLYISNNIRVPEGINNGEDYVTLPKLMYYSNKITKVNCYTYAYNQLNTSAFSANKSNWDNLKGMLSTNRDLFSFFRDKNLRLLTDVEDMYQETKAYLLLYAWNKLDLDFVRKITPKTEYKRLINIRWKYAFVLVLNYLHLDSLILIIGKKFRR